MTRVAEAVIVALQLVGPRAGATDQPQHEPLARAKGPLSSTLTQLGGPSPFSPSCSGVQSGTNFQDSAVEPSIAVDPNNRRHLVAAWQQDRWSSGGAAGVLNAVSVDSGRTWTHSSAGFSKCTGGTFQRASDPWVTIAPDGTAYQVVLALNDSDTSKAILISRSSDGGFLWDNPITLAVDPTGFFDKPTITADPNDSRYAYAVWTGTWSNGGLPAMLSRTTDGGATWQTPHSIVEPGAGNYAFDNNVVVLPDGSLTDIFILNLNDQAGYYALVRSTDHGVTWSHPVTIASPQVAGIVNPKQPKIGVRGGGPSVAVDPSSGALYVAWEDGRFSGLTRDGIAFSKSIDGGITWSAPVQVNQVSSVPAFTASIAVSSEGTVAIDYYDFRDDTSDPGTLLASYWRIESTDGVQPWRETRLTRPFNLMTAPLLDGGALFLGDYQGLVAAGNSFLALFSATVSGDPQYASRLFFTTHGGLQDE